MINAALTNVVLQAESVPNDGVGSTSLSPYFAPIEEVIIGGLASLIVLVMLYKFAWPAISDGMKARTARIQGELDSSTAARAKAEKDAAEIRTSLGDVDGERSRLFAEADTQAEALLVDGRQRLVEEIAELEAKADADISAAAGRGADDLRADIARYSNQAVEASVNASLDEATHQELIESFIARVGAGAGIQNGATS
ncbi:hypothetical protein [Ilumatobacter sp.]|uniref:F0F1 ATP synthase subunit B family protein n=1 Tax=Ilumatobacter sp. TaxID=1967498 RepID=UPI003C5336B4